MNVALIIAGAMGILAAAVHGVGGELLVVRKVSPATLPASPFGGPRMTKAMIHAAWHLTTIAFFIVGAALVVAGAALDGDAARAVGLVGASAFTGFAAVVIGLGASYLRTPRALLSHPGPAVLAGTAAVAWLGAV